MVIDEKKLKRQESQVQKWIENGCQGSLSAVTGYGKTYVAILAIQRLHRKYPDVQVDIVVPSLTLLYDWTNPKYGHIVLHKLQNVEVFVVNSYCRFGRRKPGLFIGDEAHRYASDEFIKIFQVAGAKKKSEREKGDPFILLLSATLERLDGKHVLLEEYAPIFDTIGMEEAKREGYISNYKVYNLGLELSGEDREEYNKWHNIFNNSFGKFSHNFDLAMACCKGANVVSQVTVPTTLNGVSINKTLNKTSKEWIYWWSQQQEWDGEKDSFWSPTKISGYAQQFITSMRNRKTFIYRAKVKLEMAIALVNKYCIKTMIFCEDCEFADRLAEALGDKAASYHNKTKGYLERVEIIDKRGHISYKEKRVGAAKAKERIIESFKSVDGIQVIVTVRTLNEGFDDAKVRASYKCSYNSSRTARVQRDGRPSRFDYDDPNKLAIIVNMYVIDTQEEKWLKENQRGQKDVLWITSIEQINSQPDIFDVE